MEDKKCIFDNPKTTNREYWVNGKIVGFYTKEFLDKAGSIVSVNKKAEKHLALFFPGRLIGDKEAMK